MIDKKIEMVRCRVSKEDNPFCRCFMWRWLTVLRLTAALRLNWVDTYFVTDFSMN
jgi:hypothetical protein